MLKIGYFADGKWAHLALEKILLNKDISVQFICLRYDHNDPVLKAKALHMGIDCFSYQNINSEDVLNKLAEYSCDLFVSMSFNQIFKSNILKMPPRGIINCHAGKLPMYRGRNILNWALINDEKEFGVTVHYVDEGIDTGDILLQESFPITDEDTYSTLLDRAVVACADLLDRSLRLILIEKAPRISQKGLAEWGMYCGMRKPGDEMINWSQTSRELFNFIRSICNPGPQATTTCNGKLIKINRSTYVAAPTYKGIPGQVLGSVGGGRYMIKTLDSYIIVDEINSVEGYKIKVGDRLGT